MSKLSQFEEDRKSKENALRGITVDEILQLTRAGKTPPSPAPPNESVDRSSDRDGDGDGAGAKRQAGRTGALEVGVTVAAEEEEEEEEELLSPVSP